MEEMWQAENTTRTGPGEEWKTARRHFSRMGVCYMAGTIVIFAVQLLAVWIAEKWREGVTDDNSIYLLVSMIPMYLIGMPVLIFLVTRLPAQKPEKRPMKPGQFALSVIMAFALMYGANIVGIIITMVVGLLKSGLVRNDIADIMTTTNPAVLFLFTVLCAPVMEELVFPKLIVDRTVRYGQGTAVVLSGLMFGLFHGNLNQFMYATALGMFLAFLYVKTGKLKVTIAIHMLVNFVGSMVSMWVQDLANLDRIEELEAGAEQTKAMMQYLSENMLGFLVCMMFVFFVIGVMITGIVLFIVFAAQNRFVLARGEVVIPRGKRFRTVFLNVGMALYCVFWIGMIIWQLFR